MRQRRLTIIIGGAWLAVLAFPTAAGTTLVGGGTRLGSPEDAFWVTGTLHTQTNGNSMAKAAYTLDAARVKLYKY